ncbi:MAG: methyltransferase [Bacteriovoracaceae bacterium]
MSDYSQPDFYRFNEDSFLLVNEVLKNGRHGLLLDIGAGSGVIGIELALKLNLPEVHFLELQKEWAPYLEENVRSFIPEKKTRTFWTSIGEWEPEPIYDLIVSNPPYYIPGKGIQSPDPVRANCRSFNIDNGDVLREKVMRGLKPGGAAWILERGSVIRLDKN